MRLGCVFEFHGKSKKHLKIVYKVVYDLEGVKLGHGLLF